MAPLCACPRGLARGGAKSLRVPEQGGGEVGNRGASVAHRGGRSRRLAGGLSRPANEARRWAKGLTACGHWRGLVLDGRAGRQARRERRV